ncbi:MAG: hypothetical protein M1833_002833 [Piccolia ochrophora]|nr:MAG: hypothetical protein M1833_002833 [Piccolia ochrophora]
MVDETTSSLMSKHPSIYVAPLQIGSRHGQRPSHDAIPSTRTSLRSNRTVSEQSQAQLTPPLTPHGSMEDLQSESESAQPVFHNFLRAFYPFNPDYAVSSSTITLALNEGDVVLVHSIHTNGWADGTLLSSGARGWLPTNYCEAYDQEPIRNLLKALLGFWDLLSSDLNCILGVFSSQEKMRGMIAGVRILLERSGCLTRDSTVVQGDVSLRKNRKALLSELSALVKTTKHLNEMASDVYSVDQVEEAVDQMTLKAFKLVTRGVKFLDVWNNFVGSSSLLSSNVMGLGQFGMSVPPTPPADVATFGVAVSKDLPHGSLAGLVKAVHMDAATDVSVRHWNSPINEGLEEEQTTRASFSSTDPSVAPLPPSRPDTALSSPITSRPVSVQVNRSSTSHRVSVDGNPSTSAYNASNFASRHLSATHDAFLSHQGSFIGRLHLQSRSSPDLLETTDLSVTACGNLLAVVESVSARDNHQTGSLQEAKDVMHRRISALVQVARDVFRSSSCDDDREDIMGPEESNRLMTEATACVMAAGECVARTKFVLEKIGDFEFEPIRLDAVIGSTSDGLSSITEGDHGSNNGDALMPRGVPKSSTTPPEPVNRPPPPPLQIPCSVISTCDQLAGSSTPTTSDSHTPRHTPVSEGPMSASSTTSPSRSLLPPMSFSASPLIPQDDRRPHEIQPSEPAIITHHQPPRLDSFVMGSTGSDSTIISYLRDSEMSMRSQTSTRATTPDASPSKSFCAPVMDVLQSACSSQTTLADCEDTEAAILENTFAHELICNKEGQITGGTLPALIERLTTHDATPDSLFVSTFYLTFRLFTTPVEFAKALVQRFEYAAEVPHIAGPVRLRVYNVFKGWLESHWRNDNDCDALRVIIAFAEGKLRAVLPCAGKRLMELAEKVSAAGRPLVPRLVSSIGKTNTSIAPYVSPDTPMPSPVISKSQLTSLRNWKHGGASPSILDFDPLELARQLTVKESRIFCSILPEELLAQEWTKKFGSTAVNVRAMSTLSTDLATLVADTILQFEDTKKRASIIKQWVKIANKCFELNNYDSLMAIICSLNSSTILRLKRTWEVVSQKTKATLENLRGVVEVSKNYAVLRQRLQNHVPPCLPFVGTYLTDLTFVDVGNQTTRQLLGGVDDNGHSESRPVINFDKHMKTAKIIGELQRFQIPYRLTEVPELQEWMDVQVRRVRTSDQASPQSYYRRSLLLEPRDPPPSSQRSSPIEPTSGGSGTKDKFDFLIWTHGKDKAVAAVTS